MAKPLSRVPKTISHFPVSLSRFRHPIAAVKADAAYSAPAAESDRTAERRLIERLRRGERPALEQMIAKNQERISRLIVRLTGWSNEREDLLQEVFLLALRSAKRFRGDSRISTWLTRIAINVCRSHQRKRLVRATFWKKLIQNVPADDLEFADASISQEQKDRILMVSNAVKKLRTKYREVVVLHYLEGMSAEDIQNVLGVSRNTVEVRLHRARKMLEDMLGSEIT